MDLNLMYVEAELDYRHGRAVSDMGHDPRPRLSPRPTFPRVAFPRPRLRRHLAATA